MKKVFEQLKFLSFAVNGHGIRIDQAYGELLGCWSILHIGQDVCQSANLSGSTDVALFSCAGIVVSRLMTS